MRKSAKQIADELWEEYLNTPTQTMEEQQEAWDTYQHGLSKHRIIATLAGYQFKKNS